MASQNAKPPLPTALYQFEHALKRMIGSLSTATQAAGAPVARLRDAVRPLEVVRATNDSLTRLITAAGGAPLIALKGSSPITALSSPASPRMDLQVHAPGCDPERLSRALARAAGGFAELAPRQLPAAPGRSRAAAVSKSFEALIQQFASVLQPATPLLSRRGLGLPSNTRRAATSTVAPTWLPRSLLRPARQDSVSAADRVPFAKPRGASDSGQPASIHPLARLGIRLEPQLTVMGNSVQVARAAGPEFSSAVNVLLRQHSANPRFASSDYFGVCPVGGLAAAGRRLSAEPLTRYTQRLDTLAQRTTSLAIPAARVAPRNVAGLVQSLHYLPPALRQSQLPAGWPHKVSARRRPLLDQHDRLAVVATQPAAAAPPPSTINVTINVHGVANGDDFVRRHGHAIARAVDQVMERRARRAF